MSVLVDYSQVFISNLVQSPQFHSDIIEEDLVRHMVLNSLRYHRKRFYNEYGELVICCDSREYWRKHGIRRIVLIIALTSMLSLLTCCRNWFKKE